MTMESGSQTLSKEQQQQLLFMMLVQQHQQIGMMGLGKIKNPTTDKVERDLSAARYAIDTLAMLQEYTKGNLQAETTDYLSHVLNSLRLNYVDEVNSASADTDDDGSTESEELPDDGSED